MRNKSKNKFIKRNFWKINLSKTKTPLPYHAPSIPPNTSTFSNSSTSHILSAIYTRLKNLPKPSLKFPLNPNFTLDFYQMAFTSNNPILQNIIHLTITLNSLLLNPNIESLSKTNYLNGSMKKQNMPIACVKLIPNCCIKIMGKVKNIRRIKRQAKNKTKANHYSQRRTYFTSILQKTSPTSKVIRVPAKHPSSQKLVRSK